jgi:hypothetical protein
MCIDWVSKVRLDKTARCLSVWGQKKTNWDKTAIFLSVWRQKKRQKQPKNKVKHIESESTTRFKNRSSDRMMTSDWLVDVSDDRCTTSVHKYWIYQNCLYIIVSNFLQKVTNYEVFSLLRFLFSKKYIQNMYYLLLVLFWPRHRYANNIPVRLCLVIMPIT